MASRIELDRAFFAGWLTKPKPKTLYLTDIEATIARDAEEYYRKEEMPKVLEQLRDQQSEVSELERNEMRRRYLQDRIMMVKAKYLETGDKAAHAELKKLVFETKLYLGETKEFDRTALVAARLYPLTELIESNKGMAKCPFHADSSPSLNIKNNFFYCHGCGVHGDTIDFVMKQRDLTFAQAIKTLTQVSP